MADNIIYEYESVLAKGLIMRVKETVGNNGKSWQSIEIGSYRDWNGKRSFFQGFRASEFLALQEFFSEYVEYKKKFKVYHDEVKQVLTSNVASEQPTFSDDNIPF